MDINNSQLTEIQPEEINAFESWSQCSHEGAAHEIDEIVKELVGEITEDRAKQLFIRLIEMSYDSCCPETQLLTLGVAAGARVLVHRKAEEQHLSGLWIARMQNVQRLLSDLLGEIT